MPEDKSAPRVSRLAIQNSHGFSRGGVVRFDGSNWVAAIAGATGAGIVGSIPDKNTFEFVQLGFLDGLTGLVAGEYFVSATAAGQITTVNTGHQIFTAYTPQTGFVHQSSTTVTSGGGSTGVTSAFVTSAVAAAIATEVARAESAYSPLSHLHDADYVLYSTAVVDVDQGTLVFDVDTLDQVVNID